MAMKKKNLPELVPYIFEHEKFGKVRAINFNGEPLLVGRDIATALGYSDAFAALKQHVPAKFKKVINAKTLQQMASQSKTGEMTTFEIAYSEEANFMAMKRKNVPELVPQVFEHEQFGKIRVVKIDGVAWFVGKDVAKALGYTNPQKAIRDHVDAEDKNSVAIRDGIPDELGERFVQSGQRRKIIVINKSGVYSLILDSKLPGAKKFRHWVTSEVLVKIDETGSYTTPQYDFFHPSPEELERRSKITTTAGIIEDLEAHGIDWDWEVTPRIEIDEDGVKHLVYGCKLVINHPEYEKLQKELAAKKSAGFLPD